MTYPIYLIHHAIGVTVIRELSPTIPPKTLLIGTTLLMMLIAWLIHRCVERPLVPFLKRGLTRAVTEMNSHGDQLRKRERTDPSGLEPAPSPPR
ncbi:hypothetical protein [Actinoplanes sp. CA-252034]|uniref:hypothetical protein n=1 Tax=Actinoplanes sp. CA-252034 TaxID=3239906 RepID=UPI003D98564C